MKKNFKRTMATVMALALTVTMAGTMAPEASAAKKVKLAKKSITVVKGKTKKVAIKNVKAKKVKKLTVASSKKKVATVKKSGKTAIKVTGKKVGSAKVTVKVTLKGKKKATKLTLKVKVKKATAKATAAPAVTATATAATATAATTASATPAASANASAAPAVSAEPTATVAPTPTPIDKEVFVPTGDVYPIEISADNESAATKDKDAYRTDAEFKDGGVTYTNVKEYNAGMVFYAYKAGEKFVDISAFKYVKLELKTSVETSLKGFNDAGSWWNKMEIYEGNTEPDLERTVYYPIASLEEAGMDLAKVDGFGLGCQGGSEGAEVTIKSMSLVKSKVDVVKVDTPDVTVATNKKTFEIDDTATLTATAETGTIDSVEWSVDTASVELAKSTTATTTAKGIAAGKANVTAKVTVTTQGKTFVVTKDIVLTVVKPGEVIFDAALAFVESPDATVLKKNIGDEVDLAVTTDTGSIEKVEWAVSNAESASVETTSATEATFKATGANTYTVTATVYVKNATNPQVCTLDVYVVPDTLVWDSVDDLGASAAYTVAGAGAYAEYCTITIPAAKFNAGDTLTLDYTITGDESKIQFKMTGDEGDAYPALGNSVKLNDKYTGDKDVKIMFQTKAAGFAGTCKWNSVQINGSDVVDTLPEEAGFAGLAQYTATAEVSFAAIAELEKFNKITIDFTTDPENANIYASLVSLKGKYQYSDIALAGDGASRKVTVDISSAKAKAAIAEMAAAEGNYVRMVMKVNGGATLAGGSTVTIDKVTFEG